MKMPKDVILPILFITFQKFDEQELFEMKKQRRKFQELVDKSEKRKERIIAVHTKSVNIEKSKMHEIEE